MRKLTIISRDDRHFAVSTVFATMSPIGWETLVFPADEHGNIIDYGEVCGVRYSTEAEALAGHDKMVIEFQVN